jgi:stearoyl-CoA desaturase (delta-9 desaturase)
MRRIVWHSLDLAPMILVHLCLLGLPFVSGDWRLWAVFPFLVVARGLMVTVGYHRYFAHRSFRTSRVFQFILGVLCCVNLQQGPLWWAIFHRRHHRHSDALGDPHSPFHGGFWWAYCGWLFIPLDPDWESVRDLRKYPELGWLERFWQIPGIAVGGLAWWIGGWDVFCVWFCLSAVAVFQLSFVVNTVAHLVGSRRYETGDHSRNSFLLAMLTMGDGWHNNHHHYPHSAQAGFFWWEIDPAFRTIKLLERLGIVWDVRGVPEHKLVVEIGCP